MNTFGLNAWGDVFYVSLLNLWGSFIQFTPKLIVAILFFIVGWVLGTVLARAIEQVFNSLKVDRLFASVGADDFFRKAGMTLDTGYFVGQVVKWFMIIVFLLPSLSLVLPVMVLENGTQTNAVAYFLQHDVLGYLANVIVAVLVLVIAAVVSEGLSKTVLATARTMNLRSANMLSTVAKYAVWVFAFIIALGKLGLGDYMGTLFSGIIGMVAIAGALAFGLGGKDAAGRLISRLGEEVSHK